VVNLVLCCKWRTFKDAAPGVIALVVTGIVAVRRGSAWTIPGVKVVPGVAQVLAVVCGLACRLKVKMKAFDSAPAWLPAGRCFVGNLFQAGKLYSVFCSEEEGISTSSGLFRTRL
jgi:hypothetical protein